MGGERTAYSCHPPPPPCERLWPKNMAYHQGPLDVTETKRVERIAKKRRAEAASHLTSSPYKAIVLAKPASPPSKKNTKETECDLTEKSTKIRTMKKIGHVSYVGNLHNSRSREKWIERISCKNKMHARRCA